MGDIAFPYATLASEIHLYVTGPALDDEPVAVSAYDPDLRTISIRDLGVTDWDVLTFDVVAKVPREELETSAFQVPQAVVLADCKRSNTRFSTIMAPVYGQSGGEWRTTVSVRREAAFGAVDLDAIVTAEVDGTPGRIIGRSQSWTLHLDDLPRPPITSAMSMKWVAFADTDAEPAILRSHASEPFFIDLDDTDPTLYLNSSFKGLVGLLADRYRPPGAERALHNAIRSQIAASAWQTLITDAVAHISRDEDDEPERPPEPWRETVMSKLLLSRYGADDDQAFRNLCADWLDPTSAMSVISSITSTAQHMGRVPKLLSGAIATLPEAEALDEEEAQ